MADESHVSTKQIADIEKARRNPSYLILKALAKVIGLVGTLLGTDHSYFENVAHDLSGCPCVVHSGISILKWP